LLIIVKTVKTGLLLNNNIAAAMRGARAATIQQVNVRLSLSLPLREMLATEVGKSLKV